MYLCTHVEVNGAHDTITKLLVDDGLERVGVDEESLVQPVHDGVWI